VVDAAAYEFSETAKFLDAGELRVVVDPVEVRGAGRVRARAYAVKDGPVALIDWQPVDGWMDVWIISLPQRRRGNCWGVRLGEIRPPPSASQLSIRVSFMYVR